jgi:hypothetical protein
MWNHILIGEGLSVINFVIRAAVTADLQVGRDQKPGR